MNDTGITLKIHHILMAVMQEKCFSPAAWHCCPALQEQLSSVAGSPWGINHSSEQFLGKLLVKILFSLIMPFDAKQKWSAPARLGVPQCKTKPVLAVWAQGMCRVWGLALAEEMGGSQAGDGRPLREMLGDLWMEILMTLEMIVEVRQGRVDPLMCS